MPATLLINATLLKVQDPGGTDTAEGSAPAAPGPTRWVGRSGCWYEERRDRRTTIDRGSDIYIRRTLVITDALRGPGGRLEFDDGDVVTFTRHRSTVEQRGTVQNAEHTDAPPGQPGEYLLELELA